MVSKFRSSAPMLVALLALFLALGGGSLAANATTRAARLITGQDIKDSTITTVDVKEVPARDRLQARAASGRSPGSPGLSGAARRPGTGHPRGHPETIHGDAGAVAANSCTTAPLSVLLA